MRDAITAGVTSAIGLSGAHQLADGDYDQVTGQLKAFTMNSRHQPILGANGIEKT